MQLLFCKKVKKIKTILYLARWIDDPSKFTRNAPWWMRPVSNRSDVHTFLSQPPQIEIEERCRSKEEFWTDLEMGKPCLTDLFTMCAYSFTKCFYIDVQLFCQQAYFFHTLNKWNRSYHSGWASTIIILQKKGFWKPHHHHHHHYHNCYHHQHHPYHCHHCSLMPPPWYRLCFRPIRIKKIHHNQHPCHHHHHRHHHCHCLSATTLVLIVFEGARRRLSPTLAWGWSHFNINWTSSLDGCFPLLIVRIPNLFTRVWNGK